MDMVPKVLLVFLWLRAEVRQKSVGEYGWWGGMQKHFYIIVKRVVGYVVDGECEIRCKKDVVWKGMLYAAREGKDELADVGL